jgi:hypothetical protein
MIDNVIVLRSADRYITWVALENCVEYFILVQCIGGNNNPMIQKGQELLVFRRYINAIESLNNIPDYIYAEKKTKDISPDDFRKNLADPDKVIPKVAKIANAYKHCIRGSWDKKMNLFEPIAGALNARDIAYDHAVVCDAFRFWSGYLKNPKEYGK